MNKRILIGVVAAVALVVFFVNFKPVPFYRIAINMTALEEAASLGADITKHLNYIPEHWVEKGFGDIGGAISIWTFALWFVASIIAGGLVNSRQFFHNNRGSFTFLLCAGVGLLLVFVNFVPRHYEVYSRQQYNKVGSKYFQLQEKAVNYLAGQKYWTQAFRLCNKMEESHRNPALYKEIAYQAFRQDLNLINTSCDCRRVLSDHPDFSIWYLNYRLPYLKWQANIKSHIPWEWEEVHDKVRDDLRELRLKGQALKKVRAFRQNYHFLRIFKGSISIREAIDERFMDAELYGLLRTNIDQYLEDLSEIPRMYDVPKNPLPVVESAIKITLIEILATAAKVSGAEEVEGILARAKPYEKNYWEWLMQAEERPRFCWVIETERQGSNFWVRFRPDEKYSKLRQSLAEARLWPGAQLTGYDKVAQDLARMSWEECLEDAKRRGIPVPK